MLHPLHPGKVDVSGIPFSVAVLCVQDRSLSNDPCMLWACNWLAHVAGGAASKTPVGDLDLMASMMSRLGAVSQPQTTMSAPARERERGVKSGIKTEACRAWSEEG
jgi:hypothetical protein